MRARVLTRVTARRVVCLPNRQPGGRNAGRAGQLEMGGHRAKRRTMREVVGQGMKPVAKSFCSCARALFVLYAACY